MNYDSMTKEQLVALIKQQQDSKLRHPVEFALWANTNKVEDWHADLSGTVTVSAPALADALAAALAAGKAEVKFFLNGYNGDGANNAPVIRGYSDLKEKVAKVAEAA